MKRNSSLVFSLLLLLFAGHVHAQEPAATDSVIVMGTVVDHLTNEPQPYCLLQFIQGTDTAASVRCDEEGTFVSDRLPVGKYTLCATLKGQRVYQSDLVLNDNAALYIAVVTDSFSFRNLRPVEVNAQKHLLGELLITSPNDEFLSRYEASNDGSECARGTMLCHPGLKPHPLGSTFKNELLLYGRILDTKRPAPADTTAKEK